MISCRPLRCNYSQCRQRTPSYVNQSIDRSEHMYSSLCVSVAINFFCLVPSSRPQISRNNQNFHLLRCKWLPILDMIITISGPPDERVNASHPIIRPIQCSATLNLFEVYYISSGPKRGQDGLVFVN